MVELASVLLVFYCIDLNCISVEGLSKPIRHKNMLKQLQYLLFPKAKETDIFYPLTFFIATEISIDDWYFLGKQRNSFFQNKRSPAYFGKVMLYFKNMFRGCKHLDKNNDINKMAHTAQL